MIKMRSTEIVKEFGEAFVASLFHDLGYKVDIIDEKGIDLTCYNENNKYGVSVKTRNIQFGKNESINLKYNDIVYTYNESKLRDLEPAYAFVVADLSRIDVLIVTQKYIFENMCSNIDDINDYMDKYANKNDSGSTKSISISSASKNTWKSLLGKDGVIFANTYKG